MTGFTDLDLEKDGVGTFNVNRFRIAFRSQYTPEQLTRMLLDNFPSYFNGPGGTVTREEGDKLKFFGNLPIGKKFMPTPHPDWVRVVWTNPRHGFTVQTLHRDSLAADDAKVYGQTVLVGGGVAGVPGVIGGAVLGLTTSTRLNRYHFLAGRRGWRIDYATKFGLPDGSEPAGTAGQAAKAVGGQHDLVFETAAIERSSSVEIDLIKDLMTPVVIRLWVHMLMNFAHMTGVIVLTPEQWPLEPGWIRYRHVHYTWQEYTTLRQMLGSPDAHKLQQLYPLIYQAPST